MTNPNTPGLGGILAGLGALFQGAGQARDPQAQQRAKLIQLMSENPKLREQYQQQFAGNPDGMKALLGRKPLFGRSNYDQLSQLISGGQISPETIRSQRLNVMQGQEDIYDNLSNIANAGMRVPEIKDYSKETINRSLAKGPLSAEDRLSAEEYQKTGKIQTKKEREAEAADLVRIKAATRASDIAADATEFEKNQKLEEKAQQDMYKLQAQEVIARRKKGQNLYRMQVNGEINPTEYKAIISVPEYRDAFNREMEAHFKEVDDSRQQQLHGKSLEELKNAKYLTAAERVRALSDQTERPLSFDEALAYIKDPKAALANPEIATTFEQIRFNKNDRLKFQGEMQGAIQPVISRMQKRGQEDVTQADVDIYNDAARRFTPPGYIIPVYTLENVPDGTKLFGLLDKSRNRIVQTQESIDPKLQAITKGIAPVAKPPKTDTQGTTKPDTASTKAGQSKRDSLVNKPDTLSTDQVKTFVDESVSSFGPGVEGERKLREYMSKNGIPALTQQQVVAEFRKRVK